MADSLRLLAAAGTAFLLLGLGACARPLGDFGRAEPGVLNDEVLPAAGALRAKLAGEPVSAFDKTDEETEMADRLWRFETSGRTRDWLFDADAELHRTRIEASGKAFAADRYYNWLHRTPYRSAAVRYATIGTDVDADLATLPGAFAAICAVEAIDRQRQVAAVNLPAQGPRTDADLAARIAENDSQIGDFVAALRYRYQSYSYALDRFLVETPHAEARGVDDGLAGLAVEVRRAERGDFCTFGAPRPHAGNPHPGPAVPSRFVHGNPVPSVPTPAAAAGS